MSMTDTELLLACEGLRKAMQNRQAVYRYAMQYAQATKVMENKWRAFAHKGAKKREHIGYACGVSQP